MIHPRQIHRRWPSVFLRPSCIIIYHIYPVTELHNYSGGGTKVLNDKTTAFDALRPLVILRLLPFLISSAQSICNRLLKAQ